LAPKKEKKKKKAYLLTAYPARKTTSISFNRESASIGEKRKKKKPL